MPVASAGAQDLATFIAGIRSTVKIDSTEKIRSLESKGLVGVTVEGQHRTVLVLPPDASVDSAIGAISQSVGKGEEPHYVAVVHAGEVALAPATALMKFAAVSGLAGQPAIAPSKGCYMCTTRDGKTHRYRPEDVEFGADGKAYSNDANRTELEFYDPCPEA